MCLSRRGRPGRQGLRGPLAPLAPADPPAARWCLGLPPPGPETSSSQIERRMEYLLGRKVSLQVEVEHIDIQLQWLREYRRTTVARELAATFGVAAASMSGRACSWMLRSRRRMDQRIGSLLKIRCKTLIRQLDRPDHMYSVRLGRWWGP